MRTKVERYYQKYCILNVIVLIFRCLKTNLNSTKPSEHPPNQGVFYAILLYRAIEKYIEYLLGSFLSLTGIVFCL